MNEMGKLKRQILDALFWVFFIIGITMIIWRIFGDSPTDLAIISPFIAMALMKIWSNNNRIRGMGYQVRILSINTKSAFEKVKSDMDRIENKIDRLSDRGIGGKKK